MLFPVFFYIVLLKFLHSKRILNPKMILQNDERATQACFDDIVVTVSDCNARYEATFST
jgi:hypothetical protein